MRDVELVVHLAAIASVDYSLQQPANTLRVNVAGSANIMQAARDASVARIVYASSSSVYGADLSPPHREANEGVSHSPYALSKSMTEQLARLHHRCYGTSAIGLRFFNVYGPRQDPNGSYAAVIPRYLLARRHGQSLTIYGTGSQSRDFVHVSDVASATLLALTANQVTSGVYNVGTGRPTTILELAELVTSLLPGSMDHQFAPGRAYDLAESYADMTQFELAFGTRTWLSVRDGLRLTAEHYLR